MPETARTTLAAFARMREQIDVALDSVLPPSDLEPRELHQAMRYSVMAGGKRIRPILAVTSYNSSGGKSDSIFRHASALELLHTYSLIHDDLPCMDDDDFRRGQPTLHKKFSEYIAVLAGDALHALAFEVLAESGNCAVVSDVGRAIGTVGMIGGQVRDVQAEGQEVTLADVENIHRRKTAALITASVKIGAMLANAPKPQVKMLEQFGERLGLAFQIVDDILDVEGKFETLGKSVGSDDRLSKATYPKVIGLEASRKIATDLVKDAKGALESCSDREVFWQLADYILARQT
jgi:geranylgeranyl diphosphate synthase type II